MTEFSDYDEDDMPVKREAYGFGDWFKWLMSVTGGAILLMLGWIGSSIIDMRTDIAVLKDKPLPVSQETFNVRMSSVEQRMSAVEQRMARMEAR